MMVKNRRANKNVSLLLFSYFWVWFSNPFFWIGYTFILVLVKCKKWFIFCIWFWIFIYFILYWLIAQHPPFYSVFPFFIWPPFYSVSPFYSVIKDQFIFYLSSIRSCCYFYCFKSSSSSSSVFDRSSFVRTCKMCQKLLKCAKHIINATILL